MLKKILVLGSSNIDFILRIPRFHNSGETILGETVVTAFGGKGANQAIASKRLGGKVILITKLGNDDYGKSYRTYLIKEGIDKRGLLQDKKLSTGMAFIELTSKGENRIIVSPGANHSLSPNELKGFGPFLGKTDVLVTQLEIPIETVTLGLKMAQKNKALTLVNPSPPCPLSSSFLSLVDFIVPNEFEAQWLTGLKIKKKRDISKIANRLLKMGAKNVVITLGPKGLFFKNRSDEIWMEALRVKAVDTTGAGDAFIGALAFGLSRGKPIQEVLQLANGAGAFATTKLGAQPSLPFEGELKAFLSR